MQAFLVQGPHFVQVCDLVDRGSLTTMLIGVKSDLSFIDFRMKPSIRSSYHVTPLLRFLVLQNITPQIITIHVCK